MALSAADAMKMTAGQKAVFEQLKTLRQQGVIDYYACLNVESDAWYVQFGEARIDFNTSREVLTFCYGVTAGVRRMKRARRVILRARLKSQV